LDFHFEKYSETGQFIFSDHYRPCLMEKVYGSDYPEMTGKQNKSSFSGGKKLEKKLLLM
jgi:hypothetical protein